MFSFSNSFRKKERKTDLSNEIKIQSVLLQLSMFDCRLQSLNIRVRDLVVNSKDEARVLFSKLQKPGTRHLNIDYDIGKYKLFEIFVQKIKNNSLTSNKLIRVINNADIVEDNFKCMLGNHHINDDIINSYLYLLYESKRTLSTVVFFPTRFFERLATGKSYDYYNARNFSPKQNVFNCTMLIVPVNVSTCHWAILVVILESKIIYYIDSLNWSGVVYLESMLHWLFDEYSRLYADYLNVTEWKLCDGRSCLVKQQTDGFNCGIYCLYNIHRVLEGMAICDIAPSDLMVIRQYIGFCVYSGETGEISVETKEDVTNDDLLFVDKEDDNISLDSQETVFMDIDDGSLGSDCGRTNGAVMSDKNINVPVVQSVVVDSPRRSSRIATLKGPRTVLGQIIEIHDLQEDNVVLSKKVMAERRTIVSQYLKKFYNFRIYDVAGGPDGVCMFLSVNKGLMKHKIGYTNALAMKNALRQYMLENERVVKLRFILNYLEVDGIVDGTPQTSHSDLVEQCSLESEGYLFINLEGNVVTELDHCVLNALDYSAYVTKFLSLWGSEVALRLLAHMLNIVIMVHSSVNIIKICPKAQSNFYEDYDRLQIGRKVNDGSDMITVHVVYNELNHYDGVEEDMTPYGVDMVDESSDDNVHLPPIIDLA